MLKRLFLFLSGASEELFQAKAAIAALEQRVRELESDRNLRNADFTRLLDLTMVERGVPPLHDNNVAQEFREFEDKVRSQNASTPPTDMRSWAVEAQALADQADEKLRAYGRGA